MIPLSLLYRRVPVAQPRLCLGVSPLARRAAPRRADLVRMDSAAGAAGAGSDPHAVLGIPESSDYETVNRVYRRVLYEAKIKNDKARMAEIEAAHSVLMTRFMMQRIQSGASRDVAGADQVPLLPWRPRVLVWAVKWAALSLALAVVPILWSLGSPGAGPQPIQFAFLAFLVLNCTKLWQWNPPSQASSADGQKAVVAILLRGAGLTLGSLCLGIFLAWSLPDMVMGSMVRGALPAWFYEAQWQVMTVGACTAGFIFNVFFR